MVITAIFVVYQRVIRRASRADLISFPRADPSMKRGRKKQMYCTVCITHVTCLNHSMS